MRNLIFTTLVLISAPSFGQSIDVFTLSRRIPENSCVFERCYELSDATERAGKFSFDSQEGLLDLFRARQTIKVRTGQLLPSFNLRINNPIDVFEYVPNLVGFIFPSNWFRLKESKLHAKAQEYNYVALVANQKSMAQDLFYAVHRESNGLQVLKNHVDFAEQLSDLMQMKYELGETPGEDLQEILAMTDSLKSEAVIQENLLNISSTELALWINDINTGEFPGPNQIALPDLTGVQKIDPKKYIESVIDVSPELRSFDYLLAAAKYSKKARSYDFLTPDSGTENAFGFGYLANIKIGESEIVGLKISKKSFEANLKKAITTVATKYNTAIELYQYALSIERSLNYIIENLISDYSISSKIDINRVASLIKESLSTQQMKNNAVHGFLLAKGELERLLFTHPSYASIYKTIPKNNGKLDCYLRKENKKIKDALESGELKLQDKLTFGEEETKFCLK